MKVNGDLKQKKEYIQSNIGSFYWYFLAVLLEIILNLKIVNITISLEVLYAVNNKRIWLIHVNQYRNYPELDCNPLEFIKSFLIP